MGYEESPTHVETMQNKERKIKTVFVILSGC